MVKLIEKQINKILIYEILIFLTLLLKNMEYLEGRLWGCFEVVDELIRTLAYT